MVDNAIDPAELAEIVARCEPILAKKDKLAFDWAWEKGKSREQREFHHSKTPHMTPANTSDAWRRAITTHMRVAGALGEGDHYPWKIYVNQVTGERIVPPSR